MATGALTKSEVSGLMLAAPFLVVLSMASFWSYSPFCNPLLWSPEHFDKATIFAGIVKNRIATATATAITSGALSATGYFRAENRESLLS